MRSIVCRWRYLPARSGCIEMIFAGKDPCRRCAIRTTISPTGSSPDRRAANAVPRIFVSRVQKEFAALRRDRKAFLIGAPSPRSRSTPATSSSRGTRPGMGGNPLDAAPLVRLGDLPNVDMVPERRSRGGEPRLPRAGCGRSIPCRGTALSSMALASASIHRIEFQDLLQVPGVLAEMAPRVAGGTLRNGRASYPLRAVLGAFRRRLAVGRRFGRRWDRDPGRRRGWPAGGFGGSADETFAAGSARSRARNSPISRSGAVRIRPRMSGGAE